MTRPRTYASANDISDIRTLARSPLITDDERARIDRQISEGMTPGDASEVLGWLDRVLERRRVEVAASMERDLSEPGEVG